MTKAQIYRRLGRAVMRRRVRCELSQERLAKCIGLTRTSVSNIEAGKQRILLHTLFDLARALDTTPEGLVRGMEGA